MPEIILCIAESSAVPSGSGFPLPSGRAFFQRKNNNLGRLLLFYVIVKDLSIESDAYFLTFLIITKLLLYTNIFMKFVIDCLLQNDIILFLSIKKN